MTYLIDTSRFYLEGYQTEFDTRNEAIEAVKAIISDMHGGWSTCPQSHLAGCKWRQVSQQEWTALGFDPTAEARWMHRTTRTDLWHRERIWVRQDDSGTEQ